MGTGRWILWLGMFGTLGGMGDFNVGGLLHGFVGTVSLGLERDKGTGSERALHLWC